MSNYYCMNCGSIVAAGEKYCPVCGEPVIEHKRFETPKVIPVQATADTLNLEEIKDADTAKINTEPDAKTIVAGAPVAEPVKQAKEEKKPGFFRSIFFEEVEESDETQEHPVQSAPAHETKQPKEPKKKSHHILGKILLVLLAVLIGAGAYLYFERPSVLNAGLQKIGLSLPGYTAQSSASPAATAVPSASASSSAAAAATATPTAQTTIGKLTVTLESINIRDTPATTGNALGKALQGTSYDVIATATGEGYTWYEIGQDQWIADSAGEWVTYTAN